MHQELIRELAMITDEERRILEGKQEIDPRILALYISRRIHTII